MPDHITLPADSNQALGLGQFAVDFMNGSPDLAGTPDASANLARKLLFETVDDGKYKIRTAWRSSEGRSNRRTPAPVQNQE